MANAATGWACTLSASIIAQTDTTATIRVRCYWKNQGWTYNINNVSAWVYCNGQEVQVLYNQSVNASGGSTQEVSLGWHDFVINKGISNVGINCNAKITSNSSYVSGTKWGSPSWVDVPPKPSYTISYNANGGTGAPGNQTKWYDENITLSWNTPSRTGHSFVRWNTNSNNGGAAYNPGSVYTGNSNLTLYAIWKANTYTVSYNANGGTGAPGNQTKTYGVDLTLSTTKPTRTNYNFLGWATSANGGVVYKSGAVYTGNTAITLYAVWELAYIKPRLTNFKVQRCDSTGVIDETGTYVKVTFDWETDRDVSEIGIQYRIQTDNTWTTSTVNATGTSGSVSQIIGDGLIDNETSYKFKAYVTDSGGTTPTSEISVGTIKFPIDIRKGGTGIALGKVAEEEDVFDVGYNAKFRKDIYDKYGTRFRNGLAYYTTGGADANEVLDELALCGKNIPYPSGFAFIRTMFFSAKTLESNRTQIAYPYTNGKIYERHYVNGVWSEWLLFGEGKKTLYDNVGGTTGTVTLSETAANFSYLEIFFADAIYGNNYSSVKVHNPNGKQIISTIEIPLDSSVKINTRILAISGTSITPSGGVVIFPPSSGFYSVNEQKICKVVGYK